jgi:hypothetical protein
VRRDLSTTAMARQMQLVFHGIMTSWSLNPRGSLHATAEEIWDLVAPALQPAGAHRLVSKNRRRTPG